MKKVYVQVDSERLESGEVPGQLSVPGNEPFREYHGIPLKPTVTGDCVGCGFCARMCPVQAIFNEYPSRAAARRGSALRPVPAGEGSSTRTR